MAGCLLLSLLVAGCSDGPGRQEEKTEQTGETSGKGNSREYLTLDLGGGVAMKLVRIEAGKFTMGSPASERNCDKNESPQHEVTVSIRGW